MAASSGERPNLIVIERQVTVTNDFGEEVGIEWIEVAKCKARITNKLTATAEAVASGATAYRETVQFDIRPRDIDPSWRIVHRGKVYDIKSAGTSNDGSETAVIAVAGLNQG